MGDFTITSNNNGKQPLCIALLQYTLSLTRRQGRLPKHDRVEVRKVTSFENVQHFFSHKRRETAAAFVGGKKSGTQTSPFPLFPIVVHAAGLRPSSRIPWPNGPLLRTGSSGCCCVSIGSCVLCGHARCTYSRHRPWTHSRRPRGSPC